MAGNGCVQAIFATQGGTHYSPIVTLRTGNANWTYLRDGMDSVRRILNDSQQVTDVYYYEAFGNITSQSGTTVNPFRYVGALGYYRDQTTSLYHVGARYYSPQVGRFWTQDPVKQGVNWYPYVANNPLNRVDPSGLQLGTWGPCQREALRQFGRCLLGTVGPCLLLQDALACVGGCLVGLAIAHVGTGGATVGACAIGCVAGVSAWTVISLIRALPGCGGALLRDIDACGGAGDLEPPWLRGP